MSHNGMASIELNWQVQNTVFRLRKSQNDRQSSPLKLEILLRDTAWRKSHLTLEAIC